MSLVLILRSQMCARATGLIALAVVITCTSGGYDSAEWSEEQEESYDAPLYSESHGEPIDGTYSADVCNDYSGACYGLDVDVSDGQVETIYFPNGGHLDLEGAELDESGVATGDAYTWEEGYTGETWTVEVPDMEHEYEEDF